jgi:hypothetical protein
MGAGGLHHAGEELPVGSPSPHYSGTRVLQEKGGATSLAGGSIPLVLYDDSGSDRTCAWAQLGGAYPLEEVPLLSSSWPAQRGSLPTADDRAAAMERVTVSMRDSLTTPTGYTILT